MARSAVDALAGSPLFSELRARELRRVAEAMRERTFPAGTVVATEGEVGVGFFLIEEGRALVSLRGSDIGELGPGEHFGEIALIVETPRTATVTAVTDLRCLAMTSWEFRKLVEGNAAVSWGVLQAMARRLLRLEELGP